MLLNLRLRRVRDLLLALDIWEHVQGQQERTDAEWTLLETSLAKLEALQAQTWDCVSCKLKTQSYCKEDDFWADCSPYMQAVSEVPQLKRLHYESMVLSKQIMVERLVPTRGVENKVAQAQSQLQRDVHTKTASSEASDANLSRLFSVAAQALIANKEAGALSEGCQLDCNTQTALDADVRRVLSLLQKHGGKGSATSSSPSKRGSGGEAAAGRRGRDRESRAESSSGASGSAVGFLSLASSARGEGGVGTEKRDVGGRGSVSLIEGSPLSPALVGVTLNGQEVLHGEAMEGAYLAHVTVWGSEVALGVFPTAVKAAQAHDRAYLRAVGPQNCATGDLNYPVESYSRDSMALLTAHDEALRRDLQRGSKWRGLQDCDFAFVISQSKRGGRHAGSSGSPGKSKLVGYHEDKETVGSGDASGSREALPSKRKRAESDDICTQGGLIPSSELVNYSLPDLSAWLPASNARESDRRRNTLRSQRYWKFDGASPAESVRCGDVPPLHCYILAQELLRSKAAMSMMVPCPTPDATDVLWEAYERPYAPREQEFLSASRHSSSAVWVLPAWERCLSRGSVAQRELAAFRSNMQQSLSIIEERQSRGLVKKGIPTRGSLTGVRQLSSQHSVFICTLPENVMDPLSRLSTNQDVEFGCFSYALEAAMVREQINNHGSGSRTVHSNFSSDEWDALRALSSQLAVLLRRHKVKN